MFKHDLQEIDITCERSRYKRLLGKYSLSKRDGYRNHTADIGLLKYHQGEVIIWPHVAFLVLFKIMNFSLRFFYLAH